MVLFGFVPGFPTGILMVMGLLMVFIGYVISMIEDNQDNAITRFLNLKLLKKIEWRCLKRKEEKTAAVQMKIKLLKILWKLKVLELKTRS